MTLLLGDDEVRAIFEMGTFIDHFEKASLVEDARGSLLMPPRQNLTTQDGVFLRVMPVVLPTVGILGLKMFHGSLERGVRYVVVVCDMVDGAVLAIVDAAYLTAARTGGTSGLATRHLAPEGAGIVGIIGSGLEAETNLAGVAAVRPVREVRVFSPRSERRERFARRASERYGVPVTAVDAPRAAVSGAEIVIVATNTGRDGAPAYRGEWIEPGQHLVSIGSTSPFLREVDTETFHRSDVVVFDTDPDQVAEESGDVIELVRQEPSWREAVGLTSVLAGRSPGRTSADQTTLFKSVGSAAQDLVAAHCAYETALASGIGTEVADVAALKAF